MNLEEKFKLDLAERIRKDIQELEGRDAAITVPEINSPAARPSVSSLSLGGIINEMMYLAHHDPNVLKPRDQIPNPSTYFPNPDYDRYQVLLQELNRKEREFNSYKEPPLYGGGRPPLNESRSLDMRE